MYKYGFMMRTNHFLRTIFLLIVYYNNTTRLVDVSINQSVVWLSSFMFILYLLFFVTGLAETNRIPFDLPEAEAELVAGYNVEYSALFFALFFLAEYSNMLLFTMLSTVCFLGNWFPLAGFFYGSLAISIKIVSQSFIVVWVRGVLPRFRYDQLLDLNWKRILPFLFGLFILYVTIDTYLVYLFVCILVFIICLLFMLKFAKKYLFFPSKLKYYFITFQESDLLIIFFVLLLCLFSVFLPEVLIVYFTG